jgi:two-component system, NtrC family, nitrogen regulation response regulator NtrX
VLSSYRWPGNVRELKNLIERLMILSPSPEILPEDLPADFRRENGALPPDAPLRAARDDFERRYILSTLRRCRGNVTRAAEMLEIERSNLYRKLKAYGIEVERE